MSQANLGCFNVLWLGWKVHQGKKFCFRLLAWWSIWRRKHDVKRLKPLILKAWLNGHHIVFLLRGLFPTGKSIASSFVLGLATNFPTGISRYWETRMMISSDGLVRLACSLSRIWYVRNGMPSNSAASSWERRFLSRALRIRRRTTRRKSVSGTFSCCWFCDYFVTI